MAHSHNCDCVPSSGVSQTLDELDFERGIWYAAQYNDIQRVELLLSKGTCVNAADKSGYTALHYASRSGHYDLCNLLLNSGANVNCLTRAGKATPLHRAVSANRRNIVKLLLEKGADPYLQDDDGKTILHRAVEKGHEQLTREIVETFPTILAIEDLKGHRAAVNI